MTVQTVANLQSEVSKLRHELQTLKVEDETPHLAGEQIYIANYLFERWAQPDVKVRSISFLALLSRLTSWIALFLDFLEISTLVSNLQMYWTCAD